MREAYDKWWEEVRPLMVNEDVPLAKERPYWVNDNKQKESQGIPEWDISDMD